MEGSGLPLEGSGASGWWFFFAPRNALAEKGTQIFTGHDSQLNALQAIFELYYTPTPWPSQAKKAKKIGTQEANHRWQQENAGGSQASA